MKRFMTQTIYAVAMSAALALATTGAALAQARAGNPAPAMSEPSKAVTDDIIDAIAEEVERAKAAMKIDGELRPYFIGHKVTEVDVNDVVASQGSTTWKKDRHFVSLDARVHVGSYQSDNSNFVIANAELTDGMNTITLPVEATPRIARRAAWLAIDTAYKEALEQMRAKKDTRRAGGAAGPGHDSYLKKPAVVAEKPVLVPALESADSLEQRAQAISRVFRGMSHIHDSRVAFTSFLERRWYINSEGTSAHDTRRVSGVIVVATSQAPDGQELALYYSRYGITAADLPTDAELIKQANNLAKQLDALRKAPMVEEYQGPILFEKLGAVGIVRNALASHLGGTPLPEGLSSEQAKLFGNELTDSSLNRAILSPLLSIFDDPTIARTNRRDGNRSLIGGYKFDDEGVPAERVQVVKNGILKNLLTTRTPSKKLARSNGHARRTAPGGVYHGSATNLFVRANRGVPRKTLVRRLLAEAKAQNLPYALIIRQIDDSAMTAAPELSRRELIHLLNISDTSAPPIALLAYKVYPNGKEELVRGAQLKPLLLRDWESVLAAGNRSTVANFLASTEPDLAHKIRSVRDGAVPSAGVESAIVTPDLLFRKLSVVPSAAGVRPTPMVPRPTR